MIRAAALWLVLALPVAAQPLPDGTGTTVNDLAGVMSPGDVRILDDALATLRRDTGIEGTVVTLPDRAPHGSGDGLEAFATRLFNHWGVGDARRNDGFMVLLLVRDREARIELGAGYPEAMDATAATIMNRVMLPQFQQGRLSPGLTEGTLAVIDRIARPHGGRDGTGWRLPALGPALPFLGMAGLMVWLFRSRRRRNRTCPRCGAVGVLRETGPDPDGPDPDGQMPGRMVWRRCPGCGWTSDPRDPARDRTRDATRDAGRHRGGGFGGGFGGGRSSGGGASGRF
ncbi:YgcG family protein [uncultured Paracoccus sp.]|uniref:TPM domain-containing protein n=1 Tax=uncultured Paracoccus sp. TaxID=189685 RepID=UPI0025F807B7|nr:TPM domain-containing protein [uncultured Paracoccus sp.]